jgi:hypothetical protein
MIPACPKEHACQIDSHGHKRSKKQSTGAQKRIEEKVTLAMSVKKKIMNHAT